MLTLIATYHAYHAILLDRRVGTFIGQKLGYYFSGVLLTTTAKSHCLLTIFTRGPIFKKSLEKS